MFLSRNLALPNHNRNAVAKLLCSIAYYIFLHYRTEISKNKLRANKNVARSSSKSVILSTNLTAIKNTNKVSQSKVGKSR
jgi:hypothetical protein